MKQQATTSPPPRNDQYYRHLLLAHILGHDAMTSDQALDILHSTEENDPLQESIETVRAISDVLGTDPVRLVRDYGLGRNKVSIDDL